MCDVPDAGIRGVGDDDDGMTPRIARGECHQGFGVDV